MQIIVNDYVLQRLQQLPLSSTRLARSTLRILVLKMLRLAPAKRCDCYRQSWAILTRPIFIWSPHPREGYFHIKKTGCLTEILKRTILSSYDLPHPVLWTWRDVTCSRTTHHRHILFNSISKRYCKSSHCLPFEAQPLFQLLKGTASKAYGMPGLGRILVSIRQTTL